MHTVIYCLRRPKHQPILFCIFRGHVNKTEDRPRPNAKAEVNLSRPRRRPMSKFWPRVQSGLEALTSQPPRVLTCRIWSLHVKQWCRYGSPNYWGDSVPIGTGARLTSWKYATPHTLPAKFGRSKSNGTSVVTAIRLKSLTPRAPKFGKLLRCNDDGRKFFGVIVMSNDYHYDVCSLRLRVVQCVSDA